MSGKVKGRKNISTEDLSKTLGLSRAAIALAARKTQSIVGLNEEDVKKFFGYYYNRIIKKAKYANKPKFVIQHYNTKTEELKAILGMNPSYFYSIIKKLGLIIGVHYNDVKKVKSYLKSRENKIGGRKYDYDMIFDLYDNKKMPILEIAKKLNIVPNSAYVIISRREKRRNK